MEKFIHNKEIEIVEDIVDDEPEIDVAYIIKEKPSAKVVREFFSYNLSCIYDEDDRLFEQSLTQEEGLLQKSGKTQ